MSMRWFSDFNRGLVSITEIVGFLEVKIDVQEKPCDILSFLVAMQPSVDLLF